MTVDYTTYPVLYVDDEAANLVAVRYVLEGTFELLTASSGEEALRIMAERQDLAVLLCDQRMPGMSGVEVCEAALAMRPDVVRILLTAYADLHSAIDAINRGQITRYVAKPFQNEELVEILRTAIDLVHIHRTVQDMEVRLLRTGQSTMAHALESRLAHELNNYLTVVDTNVQVCVDDLKGALQQIEGDVPHAKALVTTAREAAVDAVEASLQLKTILARMRRGEIPRDLEAKCWADRVVDSTARILRSQIQRDATLRVVLEGSPRVPMDASALGQVLVNLLINAWQAVLGREDASIVVRVGTIADRALISVTDNGPGIPPDHLERVFDPHFTTKDGGSGLGLGIAQELVTQAGGTLEVRSDADHGTVFTIELPALVTQTERPPLR